MHQRQAGFDGAHTANLAFLRHNAAIAKPGQITLDSPDKTHSLSVKKDEAAGGEIILKDFRSGEEREVYEYPRSISAIWSPNSALFLLNDAGGSDYSDCLVYILNDKTLIDLQDILKANKSLKGFSDDIPGKSYLEAKRWISNKRIELTLDGWIDTDIDGSGLYDFNLKLIFDLDKKSFEVISKK